VAPKPFGRHEKTEPAACPVSRLYCPGVKERFDKNWRFCPGEIQGAERPEFDDAKWRALELPHDWAIEAAFDPACPGAHDAGYLPGGVGWYRRRFSIPAVFKHWPVFIDFDGIYMDSDIWLNGRHLGRRPYGYSGIHHELTPHLKYGDDENLLAVRVQVRQPCSRWYSGAGIYRHAWLTVAEPVHLVPHGLVVTTPRANSAGAAVRARTRVANRQLKSCEIKLLTRIVDPADREAARAESVAKLKPGGETELTQDLEINAPRLWSPADPALYRVISELSADGRRTDREVTSLGLREFEFTRDRGFVLNGSRLPIQGVCLHHDLGCIGAAIHERALERQLEQLRSMGCNAIRTSHNPPAPELLELCDRLGFLVMVEAFDEWREPKKEFGYARFFDEWSERDLTDMIRRARNHPCVILWSIGNEVPEQKNIPGAERARRLAGICRREDPTRPVTAGCNHPEDAIRTGFAAALDVFGINYQPEIYARLKDRFVLIASETASAVSTRGAYNLRPDPAGHLRPAAEFQHQCSSYDIAHPSWACQAETSLQALRDAPWVAGEFVWTGFDYLGEPTPFQWPSRSSYFGIFDLCGFPKDRYYLYQSRWSAVPMAHLLPHWTWPGAEGREIPVWCYTNGTDVELFLNGRALGRRAMTELHAEWRVPYEPGTLRAVAFKDGREWATAEAHTAGAPARLQLRADRKTIHADGRDLVFITAQVLDDAGCVCPNADHAVQFTLRGAGFFLGADNGDPTDHESFQSRRRRAFHGLCLAVLRATRQAGRMTLLAESDGLTGAQLEIKTN